MKKLYMLLLLSFLAATTFAGTIVNFTVEPLNPMTSDSVIVYVTVEFSQSQCNNKVISFSTTADSSNASSLHCLGQIITNCTSIDTFKLGTLMAGNHHFTYTLNSGIGDSACTPGLLPDDVQSFNFTVSTPLGTKKNTNLKPSSVYPNPFSQNAIIKIDQTVRLEHAVLKILNPLGTIVETVANINNNEIMLQRKNIPQGIYFYVLSENEKEITSGSFVVE